MYVYTYTHAYSRISLCIYTIRGLNGFPKNTRSELDSTDGRNNLRPGYRGLAIDYFFPMKNFVTPFEIPQKTPHSAISQLVKVVTTRCNVQCAS
jgi:hypothetical protein